MISCDTSTLKKFLDPNHRLTEFYDNYIDSYGLDLNQPLPYLRSAGQSVTSPDRVVAWGHNVTRSLSRPSPRSAPASNHSSFGGSVGSIRRRGTRRTATATRTPGSIKSTYEDEEGYASGDYDDSLFELGKIRVKVHIESATICKLSLIWLLYIQLHYQDDIRGMTLTSETPFEEFVEKITSKFAKPFDELSLKFMYEDGGKVTLRDESDYELAIETAKEGSKGKSEGKLEIWCLDR